MRRPAPYEYGFQTGNKMQYKYLTGINSINKMHTYISALLVFCCIACTSKGEPDLTPPEDTVRTKAVEVLGPVRSGLPWHSGAWAPGKDGHTEENIREFEIWRGRPLDISTVYCNYSGVLANIANSDWNFSYPGPNRRLSVGVPIAGSDMSVSQVNAGEADNLYRTVAALLIKHNRKDAIIRIGWEADIPNNWAWHRNINNCEEYKQVWRRIRDIFHSYSNEFVFTFEGSIGSKLSGAADNEAWLRLAYPGDDVVDLVGCDTYNFYHTKVMPDGSGWNTVLNPSSGLGLQDVADFARIHKKGLILPEWGLHGVEGPGDVPQYIEYMYNFFKSNADIMAAECYFNEYDPYIKCALWTDDQAEQNPGSAAKYLELFGKK